MQLTNAGRQRIRSVHTDGRKTNGKEEADSHFFFSHSHAHFSSPVFHPATAFVFSTSRGKEGTVLQSVQSQNMLPVHPTVGQ